MLNPCSENVLLSQEMQDLIVNYYNATYESLEFQKSFGEGLEDSIVIQVKINKYSRCRIGSEIFGSTFSARHSKNSYVTAKFMTQDDTVDCYPGFYNSSLHMK